LASLATVVDSGGASPDEAMAIVGIFFRLA
jgi:hypothetical protein